MGTRCAISRSVLDAILADCASDVANERCGLLLGTRDEITGTVPAANVHPEADIAFELDPAALIAAHRTARNGGPRIIGHYHSHPGGRPVPSPRDADAAAPDGTLWLVVAGYQARLWRAGYDGPVQERFEPVELVVGPACAADSATPQEAIDAKGNSMTITPVDFASLLCSRLCHDLLSPVGALNNGLELLADETDPEMRQRCLELLTESARTSANKLKFFRLAFGAAGGFGDLIDTREARIAIEGLFGDGKRVAPHWLVEDAQLSKSAIKVLINLSLIAGDALVRGGELDIGAESANGQVEIVIRATGPRIVLDAELRRTLVEGGGEEPVGARSAAAFLVHTLVAEGGGSVQVSEPAEGTLLFGAVLSAG